MSEKIIKKVNKLQKWSFHTRSKAESRAWQRLKSYSLLCLLFKGLGIPNLILFVYHSGINRTVHSHISVAIGVAQ